MRQIRLGLKDNLNVSFYTNNKYDFYQMNQIRKGLEANLDVSLYTRPDLSWREMSKIKQEMRKLKNEQNI